MRQSLESALHIFLLYWVVNAVGEHSANAVVEIATGTPRSLRALKDEDGFALQESRDGGSPYDVTKRLSNEFYKDDRTLEKAWSGFGHPGVAAKSIVPVSHVTKNQGRSRPGEKMHNDDDIDDFSGFDDAQNIDEFIDINNIQDIDEIEEIEDFEHTEVPTPPVVVNPLDETPGTEFGDLPLKEFIYRSQLGCSSFGKSLHQLFESNIQSYPDGSTCRIIGLADGFELTVAPDKAKWIYQLVYHTDVILELRQTTWEVEVACGPRVPGVLLSPSSGSGGLDALPCSSPLQLELLERTIDPRDKELHRHVAISLGQSGDVRPAPATRRGRTRGSSKTELGIEFYTVGDTHGSRLRLGDYHVEARDGYLALSHGGRGIVYLAGMSADVRTFDLQIFKSK